MKGIQMKSYGHTEVLSFEELPVPTIKSKDLLIKVHAIGLNPFDLKLLSGIFRFEIKQEMPITIGGDFAGEVVETGERIGIFKKGMKVYGSGVAFAGGSGSMAEYLRVAEDKVALMPDHVDYATAASLVTPGCAAQQAINRNLEVKPGQKILIHGGGGAVGALAVQLCLNIGAEVAVTVDNDDIAYMKELGVDLIINYHRQPFEAIIHHYDGVLDTQGGSVLKRSYEVLKPGGKIVSLVDKPDTDLLKKYHLIGIQQKTEITTKTLNTLSFLIEESIFKPNSFETIPFNQAIKGIEEKFKGIRQSKLVIQMDSL